MNDALLTHYGPATPLHPVVLDSPHSGRRFPADFGSVLDEAALRDGEDCFIDALWRPAAERGIPLLAAEFPRTYIDPNRHPVSTPCDPVDQPRIHRSVETCRTRQNPSTWFHSGGDAMSSASPRS